MLSVVRAGASDADRDGRFPTPAVDATRKAGLFSAAIPVEFGGRGASLADLARIASTLARACGATGMIWSMHAVQVACISRHHGGVPRLVELLEKLALGQQLVASVTSEQGVGGNLRSSRACVEVAGDAGHVEKAATVVSYGAEAGAYLITARRNPQSLPSDQVAVLALRDQVTLEQLSPWNPMGMRGTCSPGFRVQASFDEAQILPVAFGEIAEATMVPLSHLLWSAVWIGLATESFERSRRFLRQRGRGNGSAPPVERRLAEADRLLAGLEAQLADTILRYAPIYAGERKPTNNLLIRVNALKLAASTDTVRIAELALETCGMAGYQEDGAYSVSRLLRDLYSARLMIANDRILDTNAAGLLIAKRK
jgi:acyl-CoA dehydrogenase